MVGEFAVGTEVQLVIQLPGRPFVTVRQPTTLVEVEWVRQPYTAELDEPA